MQSLLGTYRRMPLLHMDKSYICLEETNQRINEFSIGYRMKPNFHKNKYFKEQVKGCLKKTFVPYTNIHIGKISSKNIIVLALVMFYENRKIYTWKIFRVLSFLIYTIISKYVCIDYLGSEKSTLIYLSLGVTGRYEHFDTDYDNILGIGIPDLLLNLLSCHGFSKTVNLLSYSNVLIGCLSNILIKDSLFLNVMK